MTPSQQIKSFIDKIKEHDERTDQFSMTLADMKFFRTALPRAGKALSEAFDLFRHAKCCADPATCETCQEGEKEIATILSGEKGE